MVDSTDGSPTSTFWKRRSSAASFSMYLRYSSSVVAPTQCSSPRASAGLSMLPASIAPSALPAPTMVCSSSMKTIVLPSSAAISLSTALSRSSNSPRYLAPASSAAMSSDSTRLLFSAFGHFAVDDALRQALDDRGLAHARLADEHRVVLGAPLQHLDHAADLVVAPDHRVELALAGALGEVDGVFLERFALPFGILRIDAGAAAHRLDGFLQRLAMSGRTRARAGRSRPCRRPAASRNSSLAMNWSPRLVASLSVRLSRLLSSREMEISPPCPSTLGRRSMALVQRGLERGHVDPGAGEQRRAAPVFLLQQRGQQVGGLDEAVVVAEREALGVAQGLLELGREFVEAHHAYPFRKTLFKMRFSRPVSSPQVPPVRA